MKAIKQVVSLALTVCIFWGSDSAAAEEYLQVKLPVELYGFIKLDAAYDSARTDGGNYTRWVLSEAKDENDNQMNITANQSRFGLNWKGANLDDTKVTGKVEFDFYGGGAENKSQPMMRLAYMQIDWATTGWSLLAGQTVDIISPLSPMTNSYTVNWWAGNIGYRRPQVRVTKRIVFDNKSAITAAVGATRNIGHDTDFDPGDTGEDSGQPAFAGRVAYGMPLAGEKQAEIGLSGHWGEEEIDINDAGDYEKIDSWSGNVDVSIPLSSMLSVNGEFFIGADLDAYLGGIGQGYNAATMSAVRSRGGWGAVTLGPCGKWTFNLGHSVDDPLDRDLETGGRAKNTTIFGNSFYQLNEAIQIVLELSYWETKYIEQASGEDWRTQGAFVYKF